MSENILSEFSEFIKKSEMLVAAPGPRVSQSDTFASPEGADAARVTQQPQAIPTANKPLKPINFNAK